VELFVGEKCSDKFGLESDLNRTIVPTYTRQPVIATLPNN